MTRQPQWKRIANLGDVNPIKYGGFFVYKDRTGVYAPEVELLESPDSDDAPEGWTIYRCIIERNPEGEWWWEKLAEVATMIDWTLEDMQHKAKGTILEQARVYQDLMAYFGAHEFDSNPLHVSKRSELPRRIRRYKEN